MHTSFRSNTAHRNTPLSDLAEPPRSPSYRPRKRRNRAIPAVFVVAALSGAVSMNALGTDRGPSEGASDSNELAVADTERGIVLPEVASVIADQATSFDVAEQNRFQTLHDLHVEWPGLSGYDRADQNRFRTLHELQQRTNETDGSATAEQNRFQTLRDLFRS